MLAFRHSLSRKADTRNFSLVIFLRWFVWLLSTGFRPIFHVLLPHRRAPTVSLDTKPFTLLTWTQSLLRFKIPLWATLFSIRIAMYIFTCKQADFVWNSKSLLLEPSRSKRVNARFDFDLSVNITESSLLLWIVMKENGNSVHKAYTHLIAPSTVCTRGYTRGSRTPLLFTSLRIRHHKCRHWIYCQLYTVW